MSKTLDDYYDELVGRYEESAKGAFDFLLTDVVPDGLTFAEAFELYMRLMHLDVDVDFFMVDEADDIDQIYIENLLTQEGRTIPADNIYPNRLNGEKWDNEK